MFLKLWQLFPLEFSEQKINSPDHLYSLSLVKFIDNLDIDGLEEKELESQVTNFALANIFFVVVVFRGDLYI